jgi:L-lactate dehydrogenase complex protein LldG
MTDQPHTTPPAKAEILRRVTTALADRPRPQPAPRDYRRTLDPDTDLVELFAQRATDYRATIHHTTGADLSAALTEAAAGRRLATPIDVPPQWTNRLTTVPDDPLLTTTQLDTLDGVLTGAAAAVALTGTIILDAGPTQGRRALSLLPDHHYCVIHANQIVGTVAEALNRLDPHRPQIWISGPSATSDIELNRVEGVHGPRNLHIFIVGMVGHG